MITDRTEIALFDVRPPPRRYPERRSQAADDTGNELALPTPGYGGGREEALEPIEMGWKRELDNDP